MLHWIDFFFKISTLKGCPQNAPLSLTAQYIAIACYWAIGVVLLMQSQNLLTAIFISAVQTGLIIFVVNVSLWIKKTPERIVQTVTAITGAGSIISLFAIPLILFPAAGAEGIAQYIFSAIWLLLVAWEALMIAHVVRHALEIPFIAAVGMSMIFLYLSITITLRLVRVLNMYTAG